MKQEQKGGGEDHACWLPSADCTIRNCNQSFPRTDTANSEIIGQQGLKRHRVQRYERVHWGIAKRQPGGTLMEIAKAASILCCFLGFVVYKVVFAVFTGDCVKLMAKFLR